MSIDKCVVLGVAANEISKKVTGTSEVSIGRTAVATSAGAAAGGAVVVGTAALGLATAPVMVPLTVGTAMIAGIASLFS
jgi:hypothetical protein